MGTIKISSSIKQIRLGRDELKSAFKNSRCPSECIQRNRWRKRIRSVSRDQLRIEINYILKELKIVCFGRNPCGFGEYGSRPKPLRKGELCTVYIVCSW